MDALHQLNMARFTRRRGLAIAGATALAFAVGIDIASAQDSSSTPSTSDGSDASWTKFNLNSATDVEFATIPGVGDRMVKEFLEYRPYTTIAQFRTEIGKYVDASQVAAYEAYLFVPVDPASADADTLQQLPGIDADKAATLQGEEPYADDATFLAALAGQVSAEQAAAAPAFLASTATERASWTKFNLNTASEDQFKTIPGVGDQMVREFLEYRPYTTIVQFRTEIGKYVDESQVAAYEAYVFVPVDPASADADTLMQLPGVDSDKAATLTQSVPYADQQALLTALGQVVSADQAAAAAAFLTV